MCTFLAKFHKNSKGFTLAEVLIVVAIMSILAGFGFVAVSNYNKKLTLTEMDDTAKKIFLAAQNHLTIADANGEWKQLVNKKGTSIGDETCPTLGPSYYVIFGGKDTNSIADDVRKVMLPDQSVNLAGDGRYAIIFNKDTAAVYGVYYSASSTFGNGQDKIDFAGTIKTDIEYFDSDSSLTKFDNRKVQNPLIGYYGNSNNVGTKKEENTDIKIFQKLKIYFINSKELTLVIEDPNADIYRPLDSKEQLTRDFYITIKTSENPGYSVNATIKNENFLTINNTILNFSNQNSSVTNGIVLKDKNNVPTHLSITPTYLAKGSTSSVNEDVYFITFDSLTAAGKHFINLFQTMKPGLDVTADVTMTVNQDGKVTSLGGSATDNSLFEQIYPGNGGYTARVSNVRHLENLSQEISGVDIVENGQQIKKAILTQNLDLDNDGYSIGTPIYASDGSRNKVLSADENFIGINVPKNSAFITFEGNKKTISNMRVVGAPFAASGESVGSGLFSSVNGDFSISNLTLEKPVVKDTTGGGSGSVIGAFTGNSLSIKNLKVNGNSSTTVVDITGSKNAGGLVGSLNRVSDCAVQIKNCQIKGTRVHSESGNAGGLVGELNDFEGAANKANLTISQSKFIEPVAIEPNGTDSTADHYDIYAAKSAGGFIGTTGSNTKATKWSVTVSDSQVYSDHLFNIIGSDQVGGMIGGFYGDVLSISGALAAGKYMWVLNQTTGGATNGSCAGGFAGTVNGTLIIDNCGAGSYVYAPDADCAGGLIGAMKGGTQSSIKNTYVSGHTNKRGYLEGTPFDGSITTVGGYNVYGCTAIGGFIGYTSANGLVIENCSTTASVAAKENPSLEIRTHGILGGFIGQTQNKKSITFTNCMTLGKVFTEGRNFEEYGGSFIGEIRHHGETSTTYEFTDTYVLTGADYNDCQTAGKSNKAFIQGQIKTISVSELKEKAKTNSAFRTSVFDDALKEDNYPYPLTASIPAYQDNDYSNRTTWYFGDWVLPKEIKTFDGDFGILYYEQVQDGYGSDGMDAPTHYYYHGYVGYEIGNSNIKNGKQYTEIYTRMTDPSAPGELDRNNKALPIEHDKFVVEQGYLVLVRKSFIKTNLMVDILYYGPSNNNKKTLQDLIDMGTLVQEKDNYYSKAMKFDGFDCYYVKISDSERTTALDPNENKTQLRFTQLINNEPKWETSASFAFNPMFSDISLIKSPYVPKDNYIYKMRSAETLYNLFATGYASNTGWNSDFHLSMGLDISFCDTLKFQQFDVSTGKPKNVTWNSDKVTLSQLHFELYSDYYPDKSSMNNMYSLDYLTAPFIGENVIGNLHDMHFIHYDPSDEIIKNHKTNDNEDHTSAALLGTCTNGSEIVKNIYIENTSGPVLDMAKGSIDNVVIDKISIDKNYENQGIFFSDNEGTIKHLTIKSIDVQENGAIGAVFEKNGGAIDGSPDSGSSKKNINIEQMIISGKINSQGVLIGSMTSGSAQPHHISLKNVTIKNGATVGNEYKPSGIIGECFGGGKLHDFSMDAIKVEEGATIKGTYWGIIGSNQDEIYNFTLTGIDLSKIPLGDHIGIIGENGGQINNSSGKTISVSDYLTSGYGFVVQNDSNANINNVTIGDATIAKSGFCKLNNGTIENCTVTTNSNNHITTVIENGFVESNKNIIKNCTVERASVNLNGFVGTNESNGKIQYCNVVNLVIGQNGFVGTNNGTIDSGCIVKDTDVISGSGFAGINNGTIGNADWDSSESKIVSLVNVKIIGDKTNVAGFVTVNNRTIQHIDLKNIVTDKVGFVYTNNSLISKCRIINAWISETGFVRSNESYGQIKYCQIYGDSNVLKESNSRIKGMDTAIFDETKQTSDIYGFVQIGKGLNKSGNQYSYTDDASGFARKNDGSITYSSVTAELYGKTHASGFVFHQNMTVSNCYANTIIESNGDGYGFCFDMKNGSNISLTNCFSVGKIHATMQNTMTKEPEVRGSSGFIGSFSGNAIAQNCYSAVWEINALEFYNFVRNPGNMSGCRYLAFSGAKDSDVDYQNNRISGLSRCSSAQLQKNSWEASISTSQYGQYFSWTNQDASNAAYPYSMQRDWAYDFTFFGDWWEDGTITTHKTGTIVKAASASNSLLSSRAMNNSTIAETFAITDEDNNSSKRQMSNDASLESVESEDETILETQNSPAGITKAPQKTVTNKVRVRMAS